MPGARAALEFECLATNDSISGFTISGFSSCKILHKYNKKNKKKNRGLLHWREREERPEDSGRLQAEQQTLQPHQNHHKLVQAQLAPMDLFLPTQLEPDTANS